MATEKAVMLVIRTARPEFRNNQDKAAFAVHAAFMAAGYTLHSTGLPAFESRILESCSVTDEVWWENWNKLSELDYFGFLYSHPEQGSKRVLMRGLVINEKLYVDVLKEGDSEEPNNLEIEDTNYASQFKNLAKLVAIVNKELLSKLDGSSTSTAGPSTSSSRPPIQRTPSARTEVNLTRALQIQYADPFFLPEPQIIIFPDLPNRWVFRDGLAAGTMLNGPYPRYAQQNWRPRPPTPNNFNRARGGRIGGRTHRTILRPRQRLNLR